MKQMNLLPHIPRVVRWKTFIIVVICLISLLFASSIVYRDLQIQQTMQSEQKLVDTLKDRIASLLQRNSLTVEEQQTKRFVEEAGKLRTTRQQWVEPMQELAGMMSNNARMVQLSTTGPNEWSANFEFSDLELLGGFMEKVQRSTYFTRADIQTINRTGADQGRAAFAFRVALTFQVAKAEE